MSVLAVHQAAQRRAEHLVVDEARDVVRWRDDAGRHRETGLHVAQDFERDPELADHTTSLLGRAYRLPARRKGLHRKPAEGAWLDIAALILERIAPGPIGSQR